MTTTPQHRQPSAWVWLLVVGCALAVGYYAGQAGNQAGVQRSAPSKEIGQAPLVVPPSPVVPAAQGSDILLNEHTIRDIAKQAGKWVVAIEMSPAPGAPAHDLGHVVPGLVPYKPPRVTGTGIVLRPDGYIVTSNHIIGLDKDITVVLSDGRRLPATLLGRDWLSDVALLRVDATDLPAAKLATTPVEAGDWAVAIGSPLRLDHSISLGIVSAVDRMVAESGMPSVALIQTDAALNPGNSGGPLLNIRGELIGMNSAIRRDAQNISFAVPVADINRVCDTLMKDGKVDHAYLGLLIGSVSDGNVPPGDKPEGVEVLGLQDGPARQAGIRVGDVIRAIDSQPVRRETDLRRVLAMRKPSERLTLELVSDGKTKSLTLNLAQSPDDEFKRN
jgi:serine protease Do